MILSEIRLTKSVPKDAVVVQVVPPGVDAAKTEWPAGGGKGRGWRVGADCELMGDEAGQGWLRLAVVQDREVHPSRWYRLAGARLRRALGAAEKTAAVLVRPPGVDVDLESLCEGFLLAGYDFAEYRKPLGSVVKLAVLSSGAAADKAALAEAEAEARDIALCRDLVNRPAADLYPDSMAEEAQKAAKRTKGLKVKVFRGKGFDKAFPAIWSVGKGSDRGPCLVQVDYAPKGAKKHVVLVGKGITYDSGGYHVKPLESMALMKKDMAAAAAVLAATEAAAARGLKVRVTALLACAENMISGDAFRPGDIIPSRSGRTIEIRSTDAEGRLVLADALTYAGELKADITIDMGTLTGVAARFVGDAMAPVTGTAPEVMEMLRAAGDVAHERVMTYPMLREFKEATRGKISDLRNWGTVGGHGAGTVVCAGFLAHFAEGQTWAHIDMSNMSWADADRDDWSAGGTGYGVRLLTEFFQALIKKG